jgi:hypothetical protein
MAPAKAIKATKGTRRVAEENVPAELRNLYDADRRSAEEVSLDLTSEATEEEEEVPTEKLFSVDGVEYRIPLEFGPGVALVYLDRVGESQDVALGAVLKAVIGEEGWAALLKLAMKNRISMAQMKAIMGKVQERTIGAIEESAKN